MKTIKQLLITLAVLLCSATASAYDFEVDGIYYNITSITDLTVEVTYGDNEYSDKVIIPETVVYKSKVLKVTSIGSDAFEDCSGLTSVVIGNNVTSIPDYAFDGCSNLTSVVIGNNVTRIPYCAFSGCSNLTSVVIGNSVTSIGDYAFSGRSGLTSIEIPNSVTSIGEGAFYGCSGLTSVEIPNSVTSIGSDAFEDCSGLTSVTIGNSVTSIGSDAFEDCSGLTSVTIGNSVTSIGGYAFSGCSGLKKIEFKCAKIGTWFNGTSIEEVVIGNSVTSIIGGAFKNCSSLTNIHLLGKTPPSIVSNTFAESQYANLTIYVPQGSLSTYQSSDVWKYFWDIREEGTTETPEEEVNKCATPVITYNDNGLDITTETDGAEIHTDITCSDANSYNGDRIDLSATYSITTYATKSGYLNSDTATATLCWIAVSGSSEENSIIEVEAMPVLITCDNGTIIIRGGEDGAEVVVYSTSGVAVGNDIITNGNATVSTGLTKGETAIINIAGKGIKIVMQ